jgi:hypothetical protein
MRPRTSTDLRQTARAALETAHRRGRPLPPLPEAVIAAILADGLPPRRRPGQPMPPLPEDDLSDILI